MEPESDTRNQIKVVTKKAYSIFQKLFCCRCFHCMRADDESMLTSDIRKQVLQRMIKNFDIESNLDTDNLFDPLKFMIIIYLCEDKSIPHKLFQRCRLNPSCRQKRNRTDIQFYIPQICNFLVFHGELRNQYMIDDLLIASKLNFYFAHMYYFYMNSLSKIVLKNDIVVFHQVVKFNNKLLAALSEDFNNKQLIITDWYLKQSTERHPLISQKIIGNIQKYGTTEQDQIVSDVIIQALDICLQNYTSIYPENQSISSSFKSTINFFDDLFKIADDIKKADPRSKALKHLLRKVNSKLPSTVYIPFIKSDSEDNLAMVRLSNVLNIVWQDCRVFSTKQRAPYYICIETYNPAECLDQDQKIALNKLVDQPVSIKLNTTGGSEGTIITRRSVEDKSLDGSRSIRSQLLSDHKECQTQIMSTSKKTMNNKLLNLTSSFKTVPNANNPISPQSGEINYRDKLDLIFGQRLQKMRERIKSKSIYSHLKSWNLVHIMIKTGDNLKQQQFALQLIYQFNYIFKLQNLPLLLTPYQVLSMSPDSGILEMVKQTVTLDSLFKKMKQQHLGIHSLKQFFEAYYIDVHQAKKRFMQSLSAYSLVMYFLQVKDRHNGNILLHRDGKILHIDFGFLLSNAPGKGVQLQKAVPFKLNSQYIQVMDGIQSSYFEQFRKLFFQGFQAARKHQDRILILVKMMYSSHGSAMPCFEKGQLAIKQLQQRFNPVDITNDLQLSSHCQKLINLSLDNWATRWYDKWQYWAQGILY